MGPLPLTAAGDGEGVDRLDGHVENGLIGDFVHLGVAHHPHGPGRIVVSGEAGIREVLLLEQDLRQAPVGLVALDDQGAGGVRALLEFHFGGGAAHLDALQPQNVDDEGDARHIRLAGGEHVAEGRFGLSGFDRVAALVVEVLEHRLGEAGGQFEGGKHAGLRVVGVVAHGPLDVAVRRKRPVPFAGGHVAAAASGRSAGSPPGPPAGTAAADGAAHGVGAAVAHNLVHPQHAVVVRRHEAEVPGRPHVDESMGPDAGHAVGDHLGHLEVGEPGQFGVEDGVERGVLGRLAAEGVEERLGFVQVVHDRRVPFQVELQPVAHRDLGVIDVAIVVVVDVLAPVGRAGDAVLLVLLADLVVVVPIHVAVAAIGLGGVVDHDDDVAADLVVERGVLHGEPVRQFHQHFGRAGFGAVQAAGEHVDRLGLGDDAPGLIRAEAARVGQSGQVALVGVEVADGVFVGDGHYQALAPFVRGPGGEYFDALGGCGQGPVVAAQIGYVGEFLGSPGVVADDVLGARNAGSLRKVIDERAHELGPGGPLLHQLGVLLVLRLPGLGKGGGNQEVPAARIECNARMRIGRLSSWCCSSLVSKYTSGPWRIGPRATAEAETAPAGSRGTTLISQLSTFGLPSTTLKRSGMGATLRSRCPNDIAACQLSRK